MDTHLDLSVQCVRPTDSHRPRFNGKYPEVVRGSAHERTVLYRGKVDDGAEHRRPPAMCGGLLTD